MPRKSTGTASKQTPASKTPVKRSTPSAPTYKYEIKLFTGHGTESLFFNEEKKLERFKINVTKRNLEAAPLQVRDDSGTLFIIRGFLFAKIVVNES